MGILDLQVFLQGHKLLHIILPIIIIFALHKQFGLLKVCLVLFIVGFIKEIYDTISITDPLWISVIDIILNLTGILLGIVMVNLKNKFFS